MRLLFSLVSLRRRGVIGVAAWRRRIPCFDCVYLIGAVDFAVLICASVIEQGSFVTF